MAGPMFDFHVHFSFKAANSPNFKTGEEPDPDHWRERLGIDNFSLAKIGESTVVKSSQVHGDACSFGRHRVICNGLYPLERGFIAFSVINSVATLTGFSVDTLKDILACRVSYFQLLEKEYNNLRNNQNDTSRSKRHNTYVLVADFDQLIQELSQDPLTICIINSVEGAHAFADDIRDQNGLVMSATEMEKAHIRSLANQGTGDPGFKDYITKLIRNIHTVKSQWQHVPFFAGLSHHYYNCLAGHSQSLTGIVDLVLNQDGATLDKNGQILNYYFTGIQPWGRAVLNALLSRQAAGASVRRILVDVKHMSPQARVDYYAIVDAMLAANPNDQIPIIKSHTAVSGRRNISRSIGLNYALHRDEKEVAKFFYNGVINIFDDEIVRIVNSDGLIGLMIDERRIIGKTLPPESGFAKKSDFNKITKVTGKAINKITQGKHKITRLLKALEQDPGNAAIQQQIQKQQLVIIEQEDVRAENTPKLKPVYLSVMFRQIFHILDLVGQRGWDHLCLGTDYDGVINPMDIYPQVDDIATLPEDMERFWSDMLQHADPEIQLLYNRHLFGKDMQWWIQKLTILNGMNFLKKYYSVPYLRDGVVPQLGWVLTDAEIASLGG